MSISLHILADRLDNAQIDRLALHFQRVKPNYANVTAGARIDVAMQVSERLLQVSPTTRIIFRQGDDDGLWKRMGVDTWYATRVLPRLAWFKKFNVLFCPDNESLEGDLHPYAKWMDDAILKCAPDIQLAVGRFATGCPGENQYGQLDAMWQGLHDNGGVWSPNEYFGLTSSLSAGHLNRYFEHGWKRCKELFPNWTPTTVIGEIGLCGANGAILDPYAGFHKLGVSDADYAHRFIIPTYESWYKPNGVTVCVFSYPDWDNHGFGVGEDYFKAIEDYAGKDDTPIIMPAQIIQKRPNNATELHKVQALASINVRMQPFVALNNKISTSSHGEIQPGNKAILYTVPGISKPQWGWVYCRITSGEFSGNEGWLLSTEFQYVDAPTKEIPPVVGTAIPPNQPPIVAAKPPGLPPLPPKTDTTQAPIFTTEPPIKAPIPTGVGDLSKPPAPITPLDDTPIVQTFTRQLTIKISGTSAEAADDVAITTAAIMKYQWQILVEAARLANQMDSIHNVQFIANL